MNHKMSEPIVKHRFAIEIDLTLLMDSLEKEDLISLSNSELIDKIVDYRKFLYDYVSCDFLTKLNIEESKILVNRRLTADQQAKGLLRISKHRLKIKPWDEKEKEIRKELSSIDSINLIKLIEEEEIQDSTDEKMEYSTSPINFTKLMDNDEKVDNEISNIASKIII